MLADTRRVLHASDASAAGGSRPLRDAHRPVHPHLLPARQVVPRAFHLLALAPAFRTACRFNCLSPLTALQYSCSLK